MAAVTSTYWTQGGEDAENIFIHEGGFLSSPAEDEMDSDHSACWNRAYSGTYCIYARSLASRDSLESDQEVKRDLWHGCFFLFKDNRIQMQGLLSFRAV